MHPSYKSDAKLPDPQSQNEAPLRGALFERSAFIYGREVERR
jgi:hypothetical protein